MVAAVYLGEAPDHLMTAGQMRTAGLAPHGPQAVAGWLQRTFEDDVWRTELFDIRSVMPVATTSRRPGSQLATPGAAAEQLAAQTAAAAWARNVLEDPNAVVLDTELTDFAGRVIEIAVVSMDGAVLLNSLINPQGAPINPHAQRKHGLTSAALIGAPTMAGLWPRLDAVLQDRTVVAWNASFDQARLNSEYQRIAGSKARPPWLARMWECAMRQHGAWVGERNSNGSGYRNHKLDGGHRARGDCLAVIDRLRQMAGWHQQEEGRGSGLSEQQNDGPDMYTMREVWPQVLVEIRRRARSVEAMLVNSKLFSVVDRNLVIHHHSAPLARRLADERCLRIMREALVAALGPGWTAQIEWVPATPQAASSRLGHGVASKQPAVVSTAELEPYEDDWQDTPEGQDLESWMEINPGALCDAVCEPADADSAAARLSAFYSIDHDALCASESVCRRLLELAREARFAEARTLAEDHVLGPPRPASTSWPNASRTRRETSGR